MTLAKNPMPAQTPGPTQPSEEVCAAPAVHWGANTEAGVTERKWRERKKVGQAREDRMTKSKKPRSPGWVWFEFAVIWGQSQLLQVIGAIAMKMN